MLPIVLTASARELNWLVAHHDEANTNFRNQALLFVVMLLFVVILTARNDLAKRNLSKQRTIEPLRN